MSEKYFIPILVLAANLVFTESVKHLPSSYPRCFRDDPPNVLNDCILKATETVRPLLLKGVPELDLPAISPFIIPEVHLQQGSDALLFQASFRNVNITGLDHYKFTSFEFDVAKLQFKGAVDMGQLFAAGEYLVQGKILNVPIEGKGIVYSNISSSNGTLFQQMKLVNRKGLDFIQTVNTDIKLNIGDATTKIDGLFSDNKQLAEAADRIIQDNLQELVKEVTPAIEKVLTKIMEDVVFKSALRIPYDELFPVHK